MISVSIVHWLMLEEGWTFTPGPGVIPDSINQARALHQVYTKADPLYSGRATVPVLWDKQRQTIVNNESAEIVRMLNGPFGKFATNEIDLDPPDPSPQIEGLNEPTDRSVNKLGCSAGLASSQQR